MNIFLQRGAVSPKDQPSEKMAVTQSIDTASVHAPGGRVPLAIKVVYTAFVAVVVPYYWKTYTPWNFLFFCDIALLATAIGIWLESPLIVGMQAVGIVLPQTLWIVDFAARLLTGHHLTGMTAYMFDARIPLFVRGLSSFHGWLPFLLLWLLLRLGYDRRAFAAQATLIVVVLLACYFFGPAPPPPATNANAAININYVFGLDDRRAQSWMAPELWLGAVMASALILAGITHAMLRNIFPQPIKQ
jgi:hypothetical protein